MNLRRIHKCRHILNGTGGYSDLDIMQFVPESRRCAVEVSDMPGFVDDDRSDGSTYGVTYESHHFWTYHYGKGRGRECLIVVHHGAGWEVWGANHMIARGLEAITDANTRFLMCWGITEAARDQRATGAEEEKQRLFQAFATGRLKKRKQVGRSAVKVWVDPAPTILETAT